MEARPGPARLNPAFFARPAPEVALALLGCTLVRVVQGRRRAIRIVETEAYGGPSDMASHGFRGPTPRNASMFGRPGLLYVYFTYGMHHCMNVVTGAEGEGSAVLIRAGEPLEGVAAMQHARSHLEIVALCSGPAKLCQALAIDRSQDGIDLFVDRSMWIEPGELSETVRVTPRIGISRDAERPWRFIIDGNPFLSRRNR